MLMNNQFKEQSLKRKSHRKFALSCFLASRALNMSGYFDQSARSIERRCVVTEITLWQLHPHLPDAIEIIIFHNVYEGFCLFGCKWFTIKTRGQYLIHIVWIFYIRKITEKCKAPGFNSSIRITIWKCHSCIFGIIHIWKITPLIHFVVYMSPNTDAVNCYTCAW